MTLWRTFPAELDRSFASEAEIMDATAQLAATVEEMGGIGRWFGPSDMAAFYGSDGALLVGVTFRAEDMAKVSDPSHSSGNYVTEPCEVDVTDVQINVGGEWITLPVPAGLTTVTHTLNRW